MTALRPFVLLSIFAVCSFATSVDPLIGYMYWASQNGTQTGYFQIGIDTGTAQSQVSDYVYLTNIRFEIDIRVSPTEVNTQAVMLYRAANQSDLALNPAPATTLLPYQCSPADCPSGVGSYFTQTFGATMVNGIQVAAPQIIGAHLTYTAVTHVPADNWTYNDSSTYTARQFSPEIVSRTVSLLANTGGSFAYNGMPSAITYLSIGGIETPEPSTVALCGFGLLGVFIYRRRQK
jgi:hypothetical protein